MSTSHRVHPVEGDPTDAILFDSCDRCAEHARQLWSLDDTNLVALWRRARGTWGDATGAEMEAMTRLRAMQLVNERLSRLGEV